MKPRHLRRTSQLTAAILAMLAHQANAQSVMTWDGGDTDYNWLNARPSSKNDTVDLMSSTAAILGAVDVSVKLAGSHVSNSKASFGLKPTGSGGSGSSGSTGDGGFAKLGGDLSFPFESQTSSTIGDFVFASAIASGSSYSLVGGTTSALRFAGTSNPASTSAPISLLDTSTTAAPSPTLGISGSTNDSLEASSLAFDASLGAPVTSQSTSGTIGTEPPPVGQSNADTTYTWENTNVAASPTATLKWFGSTQGSWTNGTPVSDNTNSIKFFQDTSTPVANTTVNGTQNAVMDSGSAFHLKTLTLSGYGSATSGAHFEMTISANSANDTLNFSAATGGTINLDALNNTSANITYQLNSNIQLGTASSGTVLTFQGDGSATFNVSSSISELQTGGGSIIKTGASTVYLKSSNSYTGSTQVQGGILKIGHFGALGGSSVGTTVSSGASLQLIDTNLGVEPVTINGAGISSGGALVNISGSTYSGLLTLGSAARVNSIAGQFILSGGITGSGHTLTVGGAGNTSITGVIGTGAGGLIKDGTTGVLTLNQANTYTGLTEIKEGALNIQHAQALGGANGEGGTIVSSGAALQIQGNIITPAEPLTLGGLGQSSANGALRNMSGDNTYSGQLTLSESTRINSDSGLLTLSNAGAITTIPSESLGNALMVGGAGNTLITSVIDTDMTYTHPTEGDIFTSGTLTKDGTGVLTLSAANKFSGSTNVSGGTLRLGGGGDETYSPLGTIDSGTVIGGTNAALDLNGFSLATAEPLSLAGTGVSFGGALHNSSAIAATYIGAISLTATSRVVANSGDIILSGAISGLSNTKTLELYGSATGSSVTSVISGTSGKLTKNGTGTWTLTGANSYTGITTITQGTLQLGDGGTTGKLHTSSTITNNGNLTINRSNATAQGTDFKGGISGSGSVTITGGTGGTGVTTLDGGNLYSGGTTVSGGTLKLTNVTAGSATGTGLVTIASGATLSGTGRIGGNLSVAGTHSPGNSPGVTTVEGDVSYSSTSIFNWELIANTTTQGTSPNFTYDQVLMTGTNKTLTIDAGAKINLIFNVGSSVDFSNTAFWNQTRSWNFITGYNSFSGNFTINSISVDSLNQSSSNYPIGYPPGQFSVSGGTLTWTAVPEPTTALAGLLLSAGLLRRHRRYVKESA